MNVNDNIESTPYPDVNQVLILLLNNIRTILGDYFVGMYLYGSLASGDFEPERSDIDFLVVTNGELPEKTISDLKIMHHRMYESGLKLAKHLEGSYIPKETVRKYSPDGPAWPMINQDNLLVAHDLCSWVINNYILYNHGIVISGPPLQNVIDHVSPEELMNAVLTLLRDVWTPWQDNVDLFRSDEYQPFVVLTMCKALYTLKHGDVISKKRSAEWAMANLDKKWAFLINQALSWHFGDMPGDIGQTQDFIRYVFREAGL